jgi:hypothetical protein
MTIQWVNYKPGGWGFSHTQHLIQAPTSLHAGLDCILGNVPNFHIYNQDGDIQKGNYILYILDPQSMCN